MRPIENESERTDLRYRDPSCIRLRSPQGIDPLRWLPVKSLRDIKPNVIGVRVNVAHGSGLGGNYKDYKLTELLVRTIVKRH